MMLFKKRYVHLTSSEIAIGPIPKYSALHLTTMHGFDMFFTTTLTTTTSVASECKWTLLVSYRPYITWNVVASTRLHSLGSTITAKKPWLYNYS